MLGSHSPIFLSLLIYRSFLVSWILYIGAVNNFSHRDSPFHFLKGIFLTSFFNGRLGLKNLLSHRQKGTSSDMTS